MASRLSPRNSEVNALEQRGYFLGKKIGQVFKKNLLRTNKKLTKKAIMKNKKQKRKN